MSQEGLLTAATGPSTSVSANKAERRIAALVSTHFDFVWRLLRRFGLSAVDADDAAQQVFMITARKLESIEVDSERSYLYGVARRVVANARRAQKRRGEVDDGSLRALTDVDAQPDDLVEQIRARALLDELLQALPAPLRRVLILAEIEQSTVPEIAALEGIPLGTAASRLRRARSAFKELLERARDNGPFDGANS